jgi:hypothetical protein
MFFVIVIVFCVVAIATRFVTNFQLGGRPLFELLFEPMVVTAILRHNLWEDSTMKYKSLTVEVIGARLHINGTGNVILSGPQ